MMYVVLLVLGSIAASLTVLFSAKPEGRPRAWKLRTSWALWCLQPALLIGGLLVALMIRTAMGYTSSYVPDDVDAWLTAVLVIPVALGLLAGIVVGGLAWRAERLSQPPTSRRRWALAALLANTAWFAGGAWLFLSPPVAIAMDAVALVLLLALVVWATRRDHVATPLAPVIVLTDAPASSADEHLVG